MTELKDNIDDVENHHNETEEVDLDKYIQKFDKLAALNSELNSYKLSKLSISSNMADWKSSIIKFAQKQEEINHELLSLLADMNNIFGKSHE